MFTDSRRDAQEQAPDERVASLLAAASAPTEPGQVPGESRAMAAYRAGLQTSVTRRSSMPLPLAPWKTTVAAVAGAGVLLTGTVAAAVTGSLPGAAQDTARDMLAQVGVSVPGADGASGGHADERGSSTGTGAVRNSDGSYEGDRGEAGQGADVSETARTTTETGVDKGATISDEASDGQSQAGEDASAAEQSAGDDSRRQARVETPNDEGTDRPDNAGAEQAADARNGGTGGNDAAGDEAAGASAAGTDTADDASDDRSTAGSGNRP